MITINPAEIEWTAIRAQGAGGQNVNKVATAVQLRFDIPRSVSLHPAIRDRLRVLGGNRVSRDGVLVITAHRFRSQELNRRDAIERLCELIREAAVPPKKRRPTRPTRASRERRLESKKRRAAVKRARGKHDFT
jgi:ribosome-associated protein